MEKKIHEVIEVGMLHTIWSKSNDDARNNRVKKEEKPYTPSKLDMRILEVYNGQTARELAEMLNRAVGTVTMRLKVLLDNGLIDPAIRNKGRSMRWSKSEDEYLLKTFVSSRVGEIAAKLGRSESAVSSRYYRLTNGRYKGGR